MWHDSFTCYMPHRISLSDMPHSWHASFVTCLIRDMPRSWHASFVTCLIRVCVTRLIAFHCVTCLVYIWHDSYICDMTRSHVICLIAFHCVTCLIRDMSHSWHASFVTCFIPFVCVTWLMHMTTCVCHASELFCIRDMTHSYEQASTQRDKSQSLSPLSIRCYRSPPPLPLFHVTEEEEQRHVTHDRVVWHMNESCNM